MDPSILISRNENDNGFEKMVKGIAKYLHFKNQLTGYTFTSKVLLILICAVLLHLNDQQLVHAVSGKCKTSIITGIRTEG